MYGTQHFSFVFLAGATLGSLLDPILWVAAAALILAARSWPIAKSAGAICICSSLWMLFSALLAMPAHMRVDPMILLAHGLAFAICASALLAVSAFVSRVTRGPSS